MRFYIDDIVCVKERKYYEDLTKKFRIISLYPKEAEIVSGENNLKVPYNKLKLLKPGKKRKEVNELKNLDW